MLIVSCVTLYIFLALLHLEFFFFFYYYARDGQAGREGE